MRTDTNAPATWFNYIPERLKHEAKEAETKATGSNNEDATTINIQEPSS